MTGSILTELTKRSKAHWGYSDEQIQIWSEQLTISGSYIENTSVYKLVIDTTITGYYSFYNKDVYTIKLDNLFILPEYICKGFGRILMNDFFLRLKSTDTKKVILDSEPNAEEFYIKLGFIKTGQNLSSIKDRFLPVMELKII